MHARPRRTDRQTDRRTNIMAIARRFVVRTHHALKMSISFEQVNDQIWLRHIVRSPDVVVGLIFCPGSFFLLYIFCFVSYPRNSLKETRKSLPRVAKVTQIWRCMFKICPLPVKSRGLKTKLPIFDVFRWFCNLTSTIAANIFETKHDI